MKKSLLALAAFAVMACSVVSASACAITSKAVGVVKEYVERTGEIAFCRLFNYMARQGLILGANNLTGLIPSMYNAMDVVSREMVGMIPAVTADMTLERAAVGQVVTSPVAPAATASDINPAVTPPNDGDQNIGSKSVTISKARRVPIRWNGEEKRGLDNNGASYNIILRDQIAQGMRTLVNEVEADLGALYNKASRACGVAGTAPFGTAADLSDTAGALRILEDNGAQGLDFQLVLGNAGIQNLRSKQSMLFKVNEAGREDMLRNGMTDRLQGFALRQSAGIKRHTKGTGAAATTTATGFPIGTTVIPLASAGTGTVIAGDAITFAGDTNQYVVSVGDADVSNGGSITLAAPGLLQAIPAAATAITVTNTSFRNMFFARSAIVLATRAPALPKQGDSAVDRMLITDPLTGLTFEISMYAQYRQMQYEIALAWGCGSAKDEHIGLLLG